MYKLTEECSNKFQNLRKVPSRLEKLHVLLNDQVHDPLILFNNIAVDSS